jgi:hypothetical protein
MQWLSSEDKLSTNNPIIYFKEFVDNKYAILHNNNFVDHEEFNCTYARTYYEISQYLSCHTEMMTEYI